MVVRSPRPCRKSGCPHLCRDGSGYCVNHKPETGWSEARGTRHERGYGTAWTKLRQSILKRDRYLCQPCIKAGRPTPANQVDHIVPKSQQGTDDPTNLQAICVDCHKVKTQRESRASKGIAHGCDQSGRPLDPDHPWNK